MYGHISQEPHAATNTLAETPIDAYMEAASTPISQLVYSPPHDPHLPSEIEALQTKGAIERREGEIAFFQEQISKLQEHLRESQEKELRTLRPVMDELHARICEIQHKMASLWSEYAARMAAAQETVETEIADLQKQISFLERENTKSQSFLAPIRRLPAEMLAEIFSIALECHGQNRFHIARVCRSWRATILDMGRVWSRLTIRPSTSREQMEFVMERTKKASLEVTIDSDSISHPRRVWRVGERAYGGLASVMKTMSRWRSLTIAHFPSEDDIVAASGEEKTMLTPPEPAENLEVFNISRICESSASFNHLLDHVATTSTQRLKRVELASPNAIWSLADPKYLAFFSHLTHFKVDVRDMRDPADILPYFENLEVLEAYRLNLPMYPHGVDLPIVHTLKRMNIESVSVQWMSGRTFQVLEDCIIIRPHHPETLRLQGGVDLPVCTHFTFASSRVGPVSTLRLPKLDKMVVQHEITLFGMHSACEWANPKWVKPRVLHLDTKSCDGCLINALHLYPDLEELVLVFESPGGLGKQILNNMGARRLAGVWSPTGASSSTAQPNRTSSVLFAAPLVPKLRIFGVRFLRRFRNKAEENEITTLLKEIIQSREKTGFPLQSVKFWPPGYMLEDDAIELGPPGLCKGVKMAASGALKPLNFGAHRPCEAQ